MPLLRQKRQNTLASKPITIQCSQVSRSGYSKTSLNHLNADISTIQDDDLVVFPSRQENQLGMEQAANETALLGLRFKLDRELAALPLGCAETRPETGAKSEGRTPCIPSDCGKPSSPSPGSDLGDRLNPGFPQFRRSSFADFSEPSPPKSEPLRACQAQKWRLNFCTSGMANRPPAGLQTDWKMTTSAGHPT